MNVHNHSSHSSAAGSHWYMGENPPPCYKENKIWIKCILTLISVGGNYGPPPLHIFAYCANVLLINIFKVSRLFLTILYGHLKKITVFWLSVNFYVHFCLRDPWFYLMKKCRDTFFSKKHDLEMAVTYLFFHETPHISGR